MKNKEIKRKYKLLLKMHRMSLAIITLGELLLLIILLIVFKLNILYMSIIGAILCTYFGYKWEVRNKEIYNDYYRTLYISKRKKEFEEQTNRSATLKEELEWLEEFENPF